MTSEPHVRTHLPHASGFPNPEVVGRPVRIYVETSAVNYLANTMSVENARRTRAFQEVRQRHWYISPMVLFEIILTKDYWKREAD